MPRRFPPPWDIEDNGACFIVRSVACAVRRYLSHGGRSHNGTAVAAMLGAGPGTCPRLPNACDVTASDDETYFGVWSSSYDEKCVALRKQPRNRQPRQVARAHTNLFG
jgi:hypothetical protein